MVLGPGFDESNGSFFELGGGISGMSFIILSVGGGWKVWTKPRTYQ